MNFSPKSEITRDKTLEYDILNQYFAARDYYRNEREKKMECRQFYGGIQWTTELSDYLKTKNRPVLFFNHLQQHIDTVGGNYRMNRLDAVAKPFNSEDTTRAYFVTQLLQHFKHASNFPYLDPVIFEDCLVDNTGWYDIRLVPGKDYAIEIKVMRGEGLDIYMDINSVEDDMRDCQYLIKAPWLSINQLMYLYPDKAAAIKKYIRPDNTQMFMSSSETSEPNHRLINQGRDDLYTTDGQNIRALERWSFKYKDSIKILNTTDDRLWTIKKSIDSREVKRFMKNYAQDPNLEIFRRRDKKLWIDTWAGGLILEHKEYPVQTGHFPLVPMWCYKKARYKWSVAMNLLDYQREINKRRSSMLNMIVKAASPRWISEEGAIDIEQWLSPSDIKFVQGDLKRVQKIDEPKMPPGLWQYDQLMVGDMQHVGQTHASQGMSETSQESGRAIGLKINRSNVRITGILDRARFAKKLMCEELIRTAQQIMGEAQELRIMGEDGKFVFEKINTGPDNNITVGTYDVIIDEAQASANAVEYYTSVLLQAFQTMAQSNPGIMPMLPWEMALEGMNHPKKFQIIDRVAKATQAMMGGGAGPGQAQAPAPGGTSPIQTPQTFAQNDGGANAF